MVHVILNCAATSLSLQPFTFSFEKKKKMNQPQMYQHLILFLNTSNQFMLSLSHFFRPAAGNMCKA